MNIGFKQGKPHFSKRVIDVFFGNLALTPEFFKGQLKFIG
jgi:hypothetical protein